MTLTTTTIGAFPKPKETPIQDWFLSAKSEEERKASKGLLANWTPGAYEKAIKEAGEALQGPATTTTNCTAFGNSMNCSSSTW